MSDGISDCVKIALSRLDRASDHISELEVAIENFAREHPCIVSAEERAEWRGELLVRIVEYRAVATEDIPMAMRLVAGDAINALRSTVDNLVWCIGKSYEAKNGLSLFFCSSPEQFDRKAKELGVSRLPTELQNWMREQQSFEDESIGPSLLHTLNRLWNHDKHRAPVLVSNAAPGGTIGYGDGGPIHEIFCTVTPEGQAVVAAEGEGNLNPTFSLRVCFPTVQHLDANSFLRSAEKYIRNHVVPLFESHSRK